MTDVCVPAGVEEAPAKDSFDAKLEHSLKEFVKDDAVVDTPTSEASSIFESGRSFWLGLMDDSKSQITDGKMSPLGLDGRMTPLGRVIGHSWSNGSPLSMCSDLQDTPGALSESKDSPKSYMSEAEDANVRRKLTAARRWSSHCNVLNTKNSSNEENQDRRASSGAFVEPKTPSQSKSRRSFGDVTHRYNNATPENSAQQKQLPIKAAVRQTSFIQGSPTKKKLTTAADSKPTNGPFGEAVLSSPDPVIEIARSSQTPNSVASVVAKMQLVKISPQPDHQARFQHAYDAWHGAGLMKKQSSFSPAQNRQLDANDISKPFASSTNYNESDPVDDFQDIGHIPSGDSEGSGFKNLLRQWRDKSDEKPNPRFLSPEKTVTLESKAEEGSRLKSEIFTPKFQQASAASQPICSNTKGKEKESPVIFKRIQTYDKDYFDVVRERQASSPGDVIPEPGKYSKATNKGEEEHPKIGRSSTFGDDKPLMQYQNNGTRIVDSDVYEDQIMKMGENSRALVIVENRNKYEIMVGDTRTNDSDQLIVKNVELVNSNQQESRMTEYVRCAGGTSSVFSGNDDLITFFLPQMGMACSCGRKNRGLVNPEDPTAIENILRPWQVDFLKSFGIYRGEQLVKARHRSAGILARALRKWRKNKGMALFKTSSCGMAIDIWAKTCKSFVRSMRKQMAPGNQQLMEQETGIVCDLTHFLSDLPDAPKRREEVAMLDEIVPESQVEV